MASPSAVRILSSMPVIETLSTEEAGVALGVVPATIRERIRNGSLSAVKIGRGWRVHLASLNALLSGLSSPSASPEARTAVGSPPQKLTPRAVQNDGPKVIPPSSPVAFDRISPVQNDQPNPPQLVVSEQPSPSLPQPVPPAPAHPDDGFDANDMVWIRRYRRDLNDPDPQIRVDASWHLERFSRRAEQVKHDRLQQRMRHLSPAECRAMAQAVIDSSPPSRSAWW